MKMGFVLLLLQRFHNHYFCCRAVLNVCFSYTARDEICTAIQELAQGVQEGSIRERYTFMDRNELLNLLSS